MHPLARPLYGQCASDFYSLVNAAFRQRRKTLASALKSLEMDRQGTAELLAYAGIDSARRGETLSASEFALLAAAYRSLKHRP
jgi:16S rRNA (adenine1518-N6/adenine1519-N6)-dimethyltransferase